MKNVCAFMFVALFCNQIFDAKCDNNYSPRAVQIMTRRNDVFQLRLEDLQNILNNGAIKDRYAVVVSIAGAFRKGKSFLMNIFIKYLDANYKSRRISDWLGENHDGSISSGFPWRSGPKPKTMGIWMWSDVYTYDSDNGDKLAIILIDTQGIFDDRTSVKDFSTIFAISTMLSSVQCFNVMQNIQKDHLQQLEFFAEYGRIAHDYKSEKPFQKLLFIVRDWPYSHEANYGDGQAVIDKTLTPNDEQTLEMQELRKQIQSSFQSIGAYLLPHPGRIVAEGNGFPGSVQLIDPEFRKYVKELVISLFAPQNLIVKRINGHTIRAGDLVQYFKTYLNAFERGSLPEPKAMLKANIDASNLILLQVCLKYYTQTMEKSLEGRQLSITQLFDLHRRTKSEAVSQFLAKAKLGGNDQVDRYKSKLVRNIEEAYRRFETENLEKRKRHDENERMNRELAETSSDTGLDAFIKIAALALVLALVLGPIGEFMKLLAAVFGFIFNIFS